MSTRTFLRLTLLLITVSISAMLFSASQHGKKAAVPCGECSKTKTNAGSSQGDNMIWRSVSRHLLITG